MAKRIEGNEIINDSWAAKAVKQGEDLLKVLEKLEEQGKQTADQLSKVAKTQSGATAKSIRDITQAVSKSNAERKKSIAIDNEKKSLEEKLTRLRSNKIQQNEQLKVLISEQRRVNKQLAREATGVAGAYEKESKTLIKLRKQLKDLIITEGEGSKKTQELKRRVTELDQKLKSADAAAGQFQRNVGNYPKAMGGAIASLKKFAGALGIVGGVQLLNRGLRNTFNIVKNFDQAQANLASVLGVTRDEMSGLTEMAKELGATTKFTASEVSELQLEFAKLGFTQKEIEGVTEATLQLAAASGTDLGNAASITGSTIRAFGLDVSETQRVVDVMAQSFSASSLDINKFQTAMGNVAPVAASAGLTVEETTAMLGTLTDAGIDASTAGTGLRNVFLELSKTGMTFEEAMNQISNASDKNAASLELFGKRGATIGTVLSNSGVQIDALTERLNNAGGAAQEMADKQLDTLQGSLQLLNSAWEGYILGADGAGGVSDKLKNIVKFLAENLDTILNTVIKFVSVWGTYKIAMQAATVTSNLFGKSLGKLKSAFGIVGIAILGAIEIIKGLNEAWFEAELSEKAFNKAQEEVNTQLDKSKAKMKIYREELLKTNAGSKDRQKIINEINEQYGVTLENLESEAAFFEQLNSEYERYIGNLEKRIQIQVYEKELVAIEEELLKIRRQREDASGLDLKLINKATDELLKLKSRYQKELFEIEQTGFSMQEGRTKKALEADLDRFKKQEEIKKTGKVVVDNNEKIKQSNNELSEAEKEEQIQWEIRQQRKLDQQEQEKENLDILAKAESDRAAEIKRINDEQEKYDLQRLERQKELEKEIQESIKKTSEFITQSIQKIADLRQKDLDKQIEASEEQISKSESEVARLQELGTAQAIKSAEAEQRRIDKETAEIEDLEKKKRNLLIVTTGLERVNQLIQQGNSNPFQTTGGEIGNFISQLASFYDGTELTVADSLGKTGTKDGHIVRVHDNEHIVSAKDSDRLHANGIYKTSDIVDSALNWKNLNTSSLIMNKRNSDAQLISEIKEMRKAFNSIDFPEQYVYLDRDVFKKQNSIKTVNYSNNRI